MTLLTRFVRLFKADVHGVMDQMEDKRLLLRQYLREMETSLGRKEAQLASLGERIARMTDQAGRHRQEMDKLEKDLDLALSRDKDDIARMLIRRRRAFETAVGHLDGRIASLSREQTGLAETIAGQKLQYASLETRTEAYCRHASNDDDPFTSAAQAFAFDRSPMEVRDEEIELELIRRKEALNRGGGQ